MNELVNLIDIKDLPKGDKPEKKIQSKPYYAIIVVLVVGIVFLFIRSMWFLGVVLIGLAAVGFFCIKNRLQIEVYGGYCVIYPAKLPEQCQIFYWDDVIQWSIERQQGQPDVLKVELKDDKTILEPVLNSGQLVRAFNKKMPEKEYNRRALDLQNAREKAEAEARKKAAAERRAQRKNKKS
ncbi:MAG: hypothetical protein LKF79_05345 [Solobacterium sp.]|jgi:virulence-associated protein VagC|nr:hypothetical protein [Solobacterium sp.]MCH4222011.1 hypothetical protein [Solobacterium sp.]MCH4266048.1 hypothetical protein [Solobacterium sp.]